MRSTSVRTTSAYRELEVWIDKQDLKTAAPPFDIYLNDPSEVKDPAKFETEIVWPVTKS